MGKSQSSLVNNTALDAAQKLFPDIQKEDFPSIAQDLGFNPNDMIGLLDLLEKMKPILQHFENSTMTDEQKVVRVVNMLRTGKKISSEPEDEWKPPPLFTEME